MSAAVSEAIADFLSVGQQRGHSVEDRAMVLENVLHAVSEIITDTQIHSSDPEREREAEERDPRRHSKFDSLLCLAHDLMRAIGFVEEPTPGSPFEKDYVLPADVGVEHLLEVRAALRQVVRDSWYPEAQGKERLAARLAHLPVEQITEMLLHAAVRDGAVLMRTEALLSCADAAAWASLTDLAVSRIAVQLGGAAGLAWCACCKAYREAQPALEELVIAEQPPADEGRFRACFTQHGSGALAHRIVASLSARHASELTHLHVCAWHVRPAAPLRLGTDAHGARLTRLHTLHLTHVHAGWKPSTAASPVASGTALGRCAAELIRNVAPSLRRLRIHTPGAKLHTDDLLPVLPVIGPTLQSLEINLVPSPIFGQYSHENTATLQEAARLHCVALTSPASIRCHDEPEESAEAGFPGGALW